MFDYIRDSINPRGPEYGATYRAARAAQQASATNDDLLALQLAPNEIARQRIAQQISSRRAGERVRGRAWAVVQLVLIAGFLAFCVFVYALGNAPQSAVTRHAPAVTQRVPDDTPAPLRTVRALAAQSEAEYERAMTIPDVVDDANAVNNSGNDPR